MAVKLAMQGSWCRCVPRDGIGLQSLPLGWRHAHAQAESSDHVDIFDRCFSNHAFLTACAPCLKGSRELLPPARLRFRVLACRDLKARHRDRLAHALSADERSDPLQAAISARLIDKLRDVLRRFQTCLILGGHGTSGQALHQPIGRILLAYEQARCSQCL
jgi:hypothetical protein